MNGILSSAISGLRTNTAALDTVSGNVSNVNTTGYVRRDINLSTKSVAGTVTGVDVSDITRTVSEYLDQETLSATGTSKQYGVQDEIYQQVSAQLGNVGDGTSLASEISDISSACATLSQTPSSLSSKGSVVSSLKTFANRVAGLYAQLNQLETSVDARVSSTIDGINADIKGVADLNQRIRNLTAMGNDTSGLCDQRDATLQDLAQYLDIRTTKQSDGSVAVSTGDGATLVGDTYAQLSTTGNIDDMSITATYASLSTNKVTGTSDNFNLHVKSGQMGGLLAMHSNIADLQTEVGSLAKTVSNAYNSVSNSYSAYPPPQSLTGRQTGLTDSEALNTAGTTTIALTDSSGNLVSSLNFDFSGMSMNDIVNTINSGLSGVTASCQDGKLSISADAAGNGVVVDNTGNTGTTNFSQFFGLNDLFDTSIPSNTTTGLTGTSSSNLSADGTISLQLKDSSGATLKSGSVTVSAGDSINTVLTNLSNALDNAVTFTMNSDGSLTTSYASGYENAKLLVNKDTTERGNTGVSLTGLLGIGSNIQSAYAADFAVRSTVSDQTLPSSSISIGAVGKPAVNSGDSAGAIALQKVETNQQTIAAAGNLSARTTSISDYANSLYQDVSSRAATATSNYTAQNDRLTEAKKMQSNSEGVNLDEELSNMVVYQQAYNASARLLTTYQNLYDTLLQIAQ